MPPSTSAIWISAGAASGRCPIDNIFIFADAAYCEGDAGINAVTAQIK
jgi:hypothetical protein